MRSETFKNFRSATVTTQRQKAIQNLKKAFTRKPDFAWYYTAYIFSLKGWLRGNENFFEFFLFFVDMVIFLRVSIMGRLPNYYVFVTIEV